MDGPAANSDLPSFEFDGEPCTLHEFLATLDKNDRRLPLIVKVVSLHNYVPFTKNILTKHTPVLLLELGQLDSVIADYYGAHDGRGHTQRSRLPLSHSRVVTKSTAKLRNIKNMSKSVANLSAPSAPEPADLPDSDDENAYNLRAFTKLLNEKRSSSISLCRIPTHYRSFFELLNADDRTIEPYTRLADLPRRGSEQTIAERAAERTPFAIFLRGSCNAYTKKEVKERVRSAVNTQQSNLTPNVDSCYGSSSDLDNPKGSLVLNESPEVLSAGQTLILLDDCYAHRTHAPVAEKEPTTPVSPHFSPSSWVRSMSRYFSREHRRSSICERSPNENLSRKQAHETFDHYVKCRNERGEVVYVHIDEPVLFSLLNRETPDGKWKIPMDYIDTSDVFRVRDLLSNFRFPITVRLLDGPLSFENICAPAVIHRHDSSRLVPTKFRLLGSHSERVVFACPLNKTTLKASKSSPSLTILALSVGAGMSVQACTNMNAIERTDAFSRLVNGCSEMIKQHQAQITLVNFPLRLDKGARGGKQPLYKKRSHSASATYYVEGDSDDDSPLPLVQSQDRRRHSDDMSFLSAHSLRHDGSTAAVPARAPVDTVAPSGDQRRSGYHVKFKDDPATQQSHQLEQAEVDEIYQDVDKIYDYIRTGDTNEDMKKIFAKEQLNILPAAKKASHSALPSSPSGPAWLRLSTQSIDPAQFLPADDDVNVTSEQAHALYMADKQRHGGHRQSDVPNARPTTKMKRISKH